MSNHRRKRRTRNQPLTVKWWWRGMAKTNYRKHGKKSRRKRWGRDGIFA